MTAYENVVGALEAHGKVRHRGGSQASAQCPAHEDREPSLSVTAIEGSVLVYCHAGCATADVLDALGMTSRDLYDDKAGARYDYTDTIGTVVRSVIRTPDKKFRQTGDTKSRPVLFRLPQVIEAVAAGATVYLVEGEKDVLSIEAVGGVATTAPQGARNVTKADLSPLHGAEVVAVADADEAGAEWAQRVADALGDRCKSLRFARAAVGKDAADHIAAGKALAQLVTMAAPAVDAEPEQIEPGASWAALDLADIVAGLTTGTLTRHAPTVGRRDDGTALFYAGKVNGVAGASGSGKTWTALVCAAQEIPSRHVVFIDLEDDPAGVVGRLLDLGADPADVLARFHYVRPDEAFGLASAEALAGLLALDPVFVAIDSTGESLALDGARPNDDDDVARWFRKLPAAIARRGPAVVVLDHMTKAEDGGLWPIGSQRKRAAISGAQYVQTVVKAFGKGADGMAKLVCAKDRHGTHKQGERVADLAMTPDTRGGVSAVLRAPQEAAKPGSVSWRPTALMERVSRAIEDATEPMSRRGIEDAVQGKKEHLKTATDQLIDGGFVRVEDGQRNAKLHSSIRPYRQHDDPDCDLYRGAGDGQAQIDPESPCDRPRPLRRGDGGRTLTPSPGDSRGTVGDGENSDPHVRSSVESDCQHCGADLRGAGPRRFTPGFRCFACDRLADGSEREAS